MKTEKGNPIDRGWRIHDLKAGLMIRPYIPGESMNKIRVGEGEVPEEGGMIVRTPSVDVSNFYVTPEFYQKNYFQRARAMSEFISKEWDKLDASQIRAIPKPNHVVAGVDWAEGEGPEEEVVDETV